MRSSTRTLQSRNSALSGFGLQAYNQINGPTKKIQLNCILDFDKKKHYRLVQKIAQPLIPKKINSNPSINGQTYNQFNNTNKGFYHNSNLTVLCIPKLSIEKYLYNFCFQLGCDIPTQEEFKAIIQILSYHSKYKIKQEKINKQEHLKTTNSLNNSQNHQINTQNKKILISELNQKLNKQLFTISTLYLLIQKCLQLYIMSKKSNIGGINERLIVQIKKHVYQMGKQFVQKDQIQQEQEYQIKNKKQA